MLDGLVDACSVPLLSQCVVFAASAVRSMENEGKLEESSKSSLSCTAKVGYRQKQNSTCNQGLSRAKHEFFEGFQNGEL